MNIPLTPLRFLRYAAQQYPRRTAVVCNDERFTYAQMAERVSRLAGALRKAGLQPAELGYILNDSGASAIFIEKQFLPVVEAFRKDIPTVKLFCQLDGVPAAP